MLYLYQSNSLENLADALITLIESRPLQHVLSNHYIVIEEPLLRQWFERYYASEKGIAAGLSIVGFKPWVEDKSHVQGNSTLLADKGALFWQIVSGLAKVDSAAPSENPELIEIRSYIEQSRDPDKTLIQVSSVLCERFREYAWTRPDWIDVWSGRRKSEEPVALHSLFQTHQKIWQRAQHPDIWRNPYDRQSIKRLGNLEGHSDGVTDLYILLPELGFQHEIDWLSAYAENANVHLFCWNPAHYYWLDRESRKRVPGHNEVSHPLLQKWGKLAQTRLLPWMKLDQMQELDIDLFHEPAGSSLLHTCQREILSGESQAWTLSPDDNSLQIVRCMTRKHEVEVLFEHLCHALDHDPLLQPEDIVVVAPNIQDYLLWIKRIFESASGQGDSTYLPHYVPQSNLTQEPSFEALLQELLRVSARRLDAPELMTLLRFDLLQDALGLSGQETDMILRWLAESPHIWGLNRLHQEQWVELEETQLGAFHWRDIMGHTWSSYLAGPHSTKIRLNQPGFDVSSKESLLAFSKFIRLIEMLERLWGDMQKRLSPMQWCEQVKDWLKLLFEGGLDIQDSKKSFIQYLLQLARSAKAIESEVELSWSAYECLLDDYFGRNTSAVRLSPGKINFCSINEASALPTKHLYVLGLNQSEFPRNSANRLFDLVIESGHRQGDVSIDESDRYAFLQCLVLTKQKLYLSYRLRNKDQDDIAYPSDLLLDLERYVVNQLGGLDSEDGIRFQSQCVQEHVSQSIDASYFDDELSPLGFASYNRFAGQLALQSMDSQRFKSPQSNLRPPSSKRHPDLDWKRWLYGLLNPLANYYRANYDLSSFHSPIPEEQSDPFLVSGLDRYTIRQRTVWMNDIDMNEYRDYLTASSFSRSPALLIETVSKEQAVASALKAALLDQGKLEPTNTSVKVGAFELESITWVNEQGQFIWPSYSRSMALDLFRAWVHHVARSSAYGSHQPAQLLGLEKRITLPKLSQKLAVDYWGQLIECWHQDQTQPSLFFPKTAYAQLFGTERESHLLFLNDGTMGGALGEVFNPLVTRAVNSQLEHYSMSIYDSVPDQSGHVLFSQLLSHIQDIQIERI